MIVYFNKVSKVTVALCPDRLLQQVREVSLGLAYVCQIDANRLPGPPCTDQASPDSTLSQPNPAPSALPLNTLIKAFMEFAVIGASPSTLAGSHPLRPWGQDAEVLSRFPSAEGKGSEGERGKGDGSFVQGLGEFCFPSGASVSLVEGGAAVSRFCALLCVVFCCLGLRLHVVCEVRFTATYLYV